MFTTLVIDVEYFGKFDKIEMSGIDLHLSTYIGGSSLDTGC